MFSNICHNTKFIIWFCLSKKINCNSHSFVEQSMDHLVLNTFFNLQLSFCDFLLFLQLHLIILQKQCWRFRQLMLMSLWTWIHFPRPVLKLLQSWQHGHLDLIVLYLFYYLQESLLYLVQLYSSGFQSMYLEDLRKIYD